MGCHTSKTALTSPAACSPSTICSTPTSCQSRPEERRTTYDFVDFVYRYVPIDLQSQLEVCGELTHRWNFLAVLSTYIGPWFLDHLVYGVVNIDSVGPIGDMELETAREAGLRIINVAPAEAARDPTKSYGLEGEVGYEV